MRFQGSAFAPSSSVRLVAVLDTSSSTSLCIHTEGDTVCCDSAWVEISAPVGNLPIRFTFPDGWMFVAERTPEMSQWLKRHQGASLVDKLESHVFAWLLSAILCVGTVVTGYVYGLPWLSEKVAHAVPDTFAIALGEQVLEALDEQWQATELSLDEQEKIRLRLDQHVAQLAPLPYSVELVFRSSDMGPNAFALPGGKIVILDQMVTLADSPEQLDSILLHELGHIHHRHMLKRLAHSSLLSVAVALLTGESSGVVDNLAGLGVFFISSGHSREAEIQADRYAQQSMRVIYGSSESMAEMFEKLSQQAPLDIPVWLSTHPDIEKRIDAAREVNTQ